MNKVVSSGKIKPFKEWMHDMKMNIARLLFLCVSLLTGVRSIQAGVEAGWDFYKEREYQRAAAEFEKAITAGHDDAPTHEGLGWCYYWLGRYDSAEAAFNRSLELDPMLQGAAKGLGEVRKWRYLRFNTAWKLFYDNDYSSALAAFQEITNDQTNRLPAEEIWKVHSGMGWCYYNLGNYRESENSFRNILKIYQNNAHALKGLGFSLYRQARYVEAEEILLKTIDIHPEWSDTQSILGWNYYMKKQYQDAQKAFNAALSTDSTYSDAMYGLAWTMNRLDQAQASHELFAKAAEVTPYHPSVFDLFSLIDRTEPWWNLYRIFGWSYYRQGDYSSAEKTFEAGLKRKPNDQALLRGLGFSHFKLADYPAALNILQKVNEKTAGLEPIIETGETSDDQEYTVRSNTESIIAWCKYYGGDINTATKLFRTALETHGDWIDLHTGLAWCSLRSNDLATAETHLNNALKLNPSYPVALEGKQEMLNIRYADFYSAWNSYYSGRFQEAVTDFEKILASGLEMIEDSDHCKVYSGLGHSYIGLKKVTDAEKALTRCLDLCPDNPYCLSGLAQCHLANKMPERAIPLIKKAVDLDSANARYHALLGQVHLEMNAMSAAESSFKNAIKLNAGESEAYAGLGCLELKRNNIARAKENLQKALSIDPENEQALECIKNLP